MGGGGGSNNIYIVPRERGAETIAAEQNTGKIERKNIQKWEPEP